MKNAAVFVHRYSQIGVFGGVERVVERVTSLLKNFKWSIYCWNLYDEQEKENLDNRRKIIRIKFARTEIQKLIRLKAIPFDSFEFLWVQDIIPAFRFAILKKIKNFRMYVTLHGSYLNFVEIRDHKKHYLRRFLERRILRGEFSKIEKISAVSKNLINFYQDLGIDGIFYTPNGIDYEKYAKYASSEKKSYMVFIGTLDARKGGKELLEAFRISKEQLYLIGEISEEMKNILLRVRKRVKNIKYLGYLNEEKLLNILSHAKALVLPSYSEGFGRVLVEALAVGTPIITTKTGIAPELFEKYDAGIMLNSVPPNVSELVDAIKEIKERDYKIKSLQKIAEEYDWKIVVKKHWRRFLK